MEKYKQKNEKQNVRRKKTNPNTKLLEKSEEPEKKKHEQTNKRKKSQNIEESGMKL